MDDFVNHINGLQQTTLFAMALLVFAGTYLVQLFLDSRGLTLIFGSSFMLGALFTEYVFTRFNIVLLANRDANLLTMSAIGMCAALGILLLAVKFYLTLTRVPKVDERKRVW